MEPIGVNTLLVYYVLINAIQHTYVSNDVDSLYSYDRQNAKVIGNVSSIH